MYNRYIPQPDGTYQRSRVQEPRQHRPDRRPPPPPPKPEPEACEATANKPEPTPCSPVPPVKQDKGRPPERRHESVPGFLSQLLPKDFDTGDLIVVLLLLLLAGDCEEDRSTALLTLALYLFM